jgi:hypothetical protein
MLGAQGEATRADALVRKGSRVRSATTQMAVRRPRYGYQRLMRSLSGAERS